MTTQRLQRVLGILVPCEFHKTEATRQLRVIVQREVHIAHVAELFEESTNTVR